LARGNPSAGTGKADLHVAVRTEPAYRVFGGKAQMLKLAVPTLMGEISLGDPALDGALEDALSAVVDDSILALEDLKGLTVEAVVHGAERMLDVTASLDFRSGRSWLPRYAADAASRAQPAPGVFWQLPADAHLATYQTVSSPALHAGMLQSLSRVAEAGLSYLGTASGSRRALGDLLAELWGQKGPIVSAHGGESASASNAGTAGSGSDDPVERLRGSLGYTLVGLPIPFDRL
jgi:hypothetical protein